jgi:bifunctional non-homologous end joining protein LigD
VPSARKPAIPPYRPQLATLVEAAPDGPGWLHEIKLDGYHIGAVIVAGQVRLLSRHGRDWTSTFPQIVEAVARARAETALLDGEVAVVTAGGRTSFQALQNFGSSAKGLTYFAFDLLYLDGRDLRALPLEQRKQVLRKVVTGTRIRYSEHFDVGGATLLEHACRLGVEGIVSKRRDAPYRGTRSAGWLKVKCLQRQEFVIAGVHRPTRIAPGHRLDAARTLRRSAAALRGQSRHRQGFHGRAHEQDPSTARPPRAGDVPVHPAPTGLARQACALDPARARG